MSDDNNKTLEKLVLQERKKHHDLTLKGDADNAGIIATNARKNDDQSRARATREKDDFYLRLILDQLDEYIEQLEEDIQRLKDRIEAMELIDQLVRDQEFDLNNLHHQQLLATAQITAEEANSETLDERLSELRIELSEKEQDLISAQQIKNHVQNNPTLDQVASATKIMESSDRGKIQSDMIVNVMDSETAQAMDAAAGMTEEEQALLAEIRKGNHQFGSDGKISFASSLEDSPIKADSLVAKFAMAHDDIKADIKITDPKLNQDFIKLGQP